MYLAQANLAVLRWPIDDPKMAGFVEQIEPVNGLAEQSEGFVWRYRDSYVAREVGPPWNDPLLFFNMSVWQDLASLLAFVRSPLHVEVMRNRAQWVTPVAEPSLVLWPIEATRQPTVEDAMEAFASLARKGDTVTAFTIDSEFAR